ncbi:MAG: hypothetical protein M3Y35_08325 [Actinomycetota bacterium]|nr:hypothetical protein [Actinomycetota bacterium]
MNKFPIIYVRGFAGSTAGIDQEVDDPFYGFNKGATHVRIGGGGDPSFYQFEGPLLRLITEDGYSLLVQGDQRLLLQTGADTLPEASIWVHRFYDSAATTFRAPQKTSLLERAETWFHQHSSASGFNIEQAAYDLYDLITTVLKRTGAQKVDLVAHSMGGLIVRCMMQKLCGQPRSLPDGSTAQLAPAKDIVDKLFTYGTPHGGITTDAGLVNSAMDLFGTVGTDIFSPRKMYGYLTPGKTFGTDEAPDGWDPREIPAAVFDVDKIFCLVGTDPQDYGPSRLLVGPRSDGLVRIENAYIKGAHRAYVYKSHSGRYGEVNSEEGYQNLRRFLFGRWAVSLEFADLPESDVLTPGVTWQADMQLAVRGIPVIMSEQQAEHWCPIILNEELTTTRDTVNAPVPIVSTFLFDRSTAETTSADRNPMSRYVVTLRVFKTAQRNGSFVFHDHLEQVPDWSDALIVDVGDPSGQAGLGAWIGWNNDIRGSVDDVAQMPEPVQLVNDGTATLTATVQLPQLARYLPIFGGSPSTPGTATLRVTVRDRTRRE